MARPKKVVDEVGDIIELEDLVVKPVAKEEVKVVEKTEKEKLLELYEILKGRGIRSISDLENLIANCR